MGIAKLGNLTNLVELELSGTQMTDASIDTVLRNRSLRELRIWGDKHRLSDKALRRLLDLPYLREVSIDEVSNETRWYLEDTLGRRNAPR